MNLSISSSFVDIHIDKVLSRSEIVKINCTLHIIRHLFLFCLLYNQFQVSIFGISSSDDPPVNKQLKSLKINIKIGT